MSTNLEQGRLRRERQTMHCMVEIYCRDHHTRSDRTARVCTDCSALLTYTDRRLEKCPYGADKPTCARCPIHCYKPQPREHARVIMRYAGPRMVWRHPWLSLAHLFDKSRRVEHPMEARRRRADR